MCVKIERERIERNILMFTSMVLNVCLRLFDFGVIRALHQPSTSSLKIPENIYH